MRIAIAFTRKDGAEREFSFPMREHGQRASNDAVLAISEAAEFLGVTPNEVLTAVQLVAKSRVNILRSALENGRAI